MDTERVGEQAAGTETEALREQVVEAIKTCYDPEIPVNIYELGLVYGVEVEASGFANVKMTLTSPNCPAAQSLPGEVETKIKTVPGVSDAMIEIVWEPPWNIDMMSADAKLELGIDY
ncbi:MAG: DUF59 domain-containing protein [candidate division Zixibacteria bacterium]|nr:DUF59 domain-containing protein [candidate division Zixibacteria bacterium]